MSVHNGMSRPRITPASSSSSHPLTPCTIQPRHFSCRSNQATTSGVSSTSHTCTSASIAHPDALSPDHSLDTPPLQPHDSRMRGHVRTFRDRCHTYMNGTDTAKQMLCRTNHHHLRRSRVVGVDHATIMTGWVRRRLRHDGRSPKTSSDLTMHGIHAYMDRTAADDYYATPSSSAPSSPPPILTIAPAEERSGGGANTHSWARTRSTPQQTVCPNPSYWSREDGNALYRNTVWSCGEGGRAESETYSLLDGTGAASERQREYTQRRGQDSADEAGRSTQTVPRRSLKKHSYHHICDDDAVGEEEDYDHHRETTTTTRVSTRASTAQGSHHYTRRTQATNLREPSSQTSYSMLHYASVPATSHRVATTGAVDHDVLVPNALPRPSSSILCLRACRPTRQAPPPPVAAHLVAKQTGDELVQGAISVKDRLPPTHTTIPFPRSMRCCCSVWPRPSYSSLFVPRDVRCLEPILMHYLVLHRWRTVPHGNDYRIQRRPCHTAGQHVASRAQTIHHSQEDADDDNGNHNNNNNNNTHHTGHDSPRPRTAATRETRAESASTDVASQGQTVWWLHNARPAGQFVFLITPVLPPPAPASTTATTPSRNPAEMPLGTGWGKGWLNYLSSLLRRRPCEDCERSSTTPSPQHNENEDKDICNEPDLLHVLVPKQPNDVHNQQQRQQQQNETEMDSDSNDDKKEADQSPAATSMPNRESGKCDSELGCAPAFVNGASDTRFRFLLSSISRLCSVARLCSEGARGAPGATPDPAGAASASSPWSPHAPEQQLMNTLSVVPPSCPSDVSSPSSHMGDVSCAHDYSPNPRMHSGGHTCRCEDMPNNHDAGACSGDSSNSQSNSNSHGSNNTSRSHAPTRFAAPNLAPHHGPSDSAGSSFCYRVSSRATSTSNSSNEPYCGAHNNVHSHDYPHIETETETTAAKMKTKKNSHARTSHSSHNNNNNITGGGDDKKNDHAEKSCRGCDHVDGHRSECGVEAVVILHEDTTGLDFQTSLMTSRWSMEVRVVRTYYFAFMTDALTYFGCPNANTDIDTHAFVPCCCRGYQGSAVTPCMAHQLHHDSHHYGCPESDARAPCDAVAVKGAGAGAAAAAVSRPPMMYHPHDASLRTHNTPLPEPQLISAHFDTIVSVYSTDPSLSVVLRELLLMPYDSPAAPPSSASASAAAVPHVPSAHCRSSGGGSSSSSLSSSSSGRVPPMCGGENPLPQSAAAWYTLSRSEQRRLLSLYETGLPYWALMLATTRLPYRHHLRITVVLLSNLWPFISLFVGFYDLYRHLPHMKRILHYLVDPTVRWVERHVTVRVSVMCTYVLSVWLSIVTNLHLICPPFRVLHHLALLQLLWSLIFLPIQLIVDTTTTLVGVIYLLYQLSWTVVWWVSQYAYALGQLCSQTSLIQAVVSAVRESTLVSFLLCAWLAWQEFYTTVAAPVKNAISGVWDSINHVMRSLWRHENTIRSSVASWQAQVTLFLSMWHEWLWNCVYEGPSVMTMAMLQQHSQHPHHHHNHLRHGRWYLSRRQRRFWALVRWVILPPCVILLVCMLLGITPRTWTELKNIAMALVNLMQGLPWRGTWMEMNSVDII